MAANKLYQGKSCLCISGAQFFCHQTIYMRKRAKFWAMNMAKEVSRYKPDASVSHFCSVSGFCKLDERHVQHLAMVAWYLAKSCGHIGSTFKLRKNEGKKHKKGSKAKALFKDFRSLAGQESDLNMTANKRHASGQWASVMSWNTCLVSVLIGLYMLDAYICFSGVRAS